MRFSVVADVFDMLESTSGRIEMAQIFANLLKRANKSIVRHLVYVSTGVLAPSYEGIELGLGEQYGIRAIARAFGYTESHVDNLFEEKGDLGTVAEILCETKRQGNLFPKSLTFEHVYSSFVKIAKTSGKGSQDLKIKLLMELLTNAMPNEAKYIIRFVLGQLRLGIREATIIDALSMVKSSDKSWKDKLDRAFNITSDLGYVAELFLKDPGLIDGLKVSPFKPLMPALAERLPTAEEIVDKLGGKCAVESKYDGMRMQIHKQGSRVEIYSRKLEKLTSMFPDVVSDVLKIPYQSIIFEGETLAFDSENNRFYSFQETIRRRRKHSIGKVSKELPMFVFVFDVMYIDGKDMTDVPYIERRNKIESVFPVSSIKPSEMHIVSNPEELESLFENTISRGLEGVIAKDLNAPYTAGKRKFAWIKLKKSYGSSMDTIDGVIVGYYFGKGHRSEFGIGGVLVAVMDDQTGSLETVAKVGSGFTEVEMKNLKSKLDEIRISVPDRRIHAPNVDIVDVWVKPKIVVEVAFDNITLSLVHTCCFDKSTKKGYALRFPRIVRFRDDKSISEITLSNEVKEMYDLQIDSG